MTPRRWRGVFRTRSRPGHGDDREECLRHDPDERIERRLDRRRWIVPDDDPASIKALTRTPTAANLIRVFSLQERLKSLGKEDAFRASHVHVVGGGTMGGDIAAWCALRGLTVTLQDQNAERLSPAMQRAAKLFGERLKDARRARDAVINGE